VQAGVWKADGFLGAAVVVALALLAVAIYFVLMRKHAPRAVSKPKLAERAALAPAVVDNARAWT
jgi:hypothetical protein